MSKEDGETPNANGNISEFPLREGDSESEEREFLVDIDTHHAILVTAMNVDEAIAKALHDDADDMRTTVVSHDVHVCVHSGISDNECDHKEGAE